MGNDMGLFSWLGRLFAGSWQFLWRIAPVGCAVLLVGLLVLAVVEPYGIARGWLRGEKFHQYRPASYWRQQFATGWNEADRGQKVRLRYWDPKLDGSAILCDFLTDAEVHIRRMAAESLLLDGPQNPATVEPLRQALRDDDATVRGFAAQALATRGPAGVAATEALLALLNDPDPSLRHRAECGLWGVNPDRAADHFGWITYRSERWGFTARLPCAPDETTVAIFDPVWTRTYHWFIARAGAVTIAIEVAEESEDIESPEELEDEYPHYIMPREWLAGLHASWSMAREITPEGNMVLLSNGGGTSPQRGLILTRDTVFALKDQFQPNWEQHFAAGDTSGLNTGLPYRRGLLEYARQSFQARAPDR